MALEERGRPARPGRWGTGRTAGEHDPRRRSREPRIGAVAFSIVAQPWVNLVVPLPNAGSGSVVSSVRPCAFSHSAAARAAVASLAQRRGRGPGQGNRRAGSAWGAGPRASRRGPRTARDGGGEEGGEGQGTGRGAGIRGGLR